jgi:hypothetical protein
MDPMGDAHPEAHDAARGSAERSGGGEVRDIARTTTIREANCSATSLRLCEDPLAVLLSDFIDEPDLAPGAPTSFVQKPAERLNDSLLIAPVPAA